MTPERIDTVVVGGGQAGLATGYHLQRLGIPFVILDATTRVGDAWRQRWDSLRLFTPARYDRLPGMRFPTGFTYFPTKDEMADYLESYAKHFDLPVRSDTRVDQIKMNRGRFAVSAGSKEFEANHVVVAMGNQIPRIPVYATELHPGILQLHSLHYRNPRQFRPGEVLVVGAGNSGAEVAMDAVATRKTWLSGEHPGQMPFPINRVSAATVMPLARQVLHRVLTTSTPIGRKARPKILGHGAPLMRTKAKHLATAGVARVARTIGARDGLPLLETGEVLDVANVVWCTGFRPDFSYIDLPIFEEREPRHRRGIVPEAPGLYFVGLDFLYSLSSSQINGIDRDARHVAMAISKSAESRETQVQALNPSKG
ncbi:MAG TPA: NAD(P)-binding domain-containing protein [Acidimicrobiia bacterium]|jgi:putative flavoprotein involved in K+ transport|nr:NAD(P)-binding domain-containing protein [Acidimicrobiia bacterium]